MPTTTQAARQLVSQSACFPSSPLPTRLSHAHAQADFTMVYTLFSQLLIIVWWRIWVRAENEYRFRWKRLDLTEGDVGLLHASCCMPRRASRCMPRRASCCMPRRASRCLCAALPV